MPANHIADDVEYYNTVEELYTESDLVETDAYVQGWSKKFRIRGLSFKQQEEINKHSTDKDSGELLHDEWVYHTIAQGVIRPRITYEQAKKLADKNGTFLNMLADEIWAIGRVSKSLFDDYIANLKTLQELEKAKEAAKAKK